MKTLDQLKDEALNLVISFADRDLGNEKMYDKCAHIYSQVIMLGAKYKVDQEVFILEDGDHGITRADVESICLRGKNRFGYRLRERTGRTVNSGAFIDEERVFLNVDDLREYYRKRLGL